MRFSTATAISLSFVAGAIAQEVHQVSVGKGGLNFDPTSITAKEGDTILFTFYPKNHSVVQSTFANPCSTKQDGWDSGFQSVESDSATKTWNVTVNNTDPVWFYCSQRTPVNHCAQGMVFAVNPTENATFDAFQGKAKESANATGNGNSGNSTSSATNPGSTSPSGNSGNNGAVGLEGAHTFGLLSMAGLALGLVL